MPKVSVRSRVVKSRQNPVRCILLCLLVLSHQGLQPVHVGSGQVGDLGLGLNEDEGRHGGDLVLGGHVLAVVNIDLEEHHVVHRLAHLLEVGSNQLAWSAPSSEEIDNDKFSSRSFQLGIEVRKIFAGVHHLGQKLPANWRESSSRYMPDEIGNWVHLSVRPSVTLLSSS